MCPLEPYEYDSTNRMLRMEIKIHVLACLSQEIYKYQQRPRNHKFITERILPFSNVVICEEIYVVRVEQKMHEINLLLSRWKY